MAKKTKGKEKQTDEEKLGVLKGIRKTLKDLSATLSGEEQTEEETEEEETEEEETTGAAGTTTEEETETETESEEESTAGETSMDNKSILKRLDKLEQKEYKQEKIIKKQSATIKELTKDNKELKASKTKKAHTALVKKALDYSKEIKDVGVVDEKTLEKAVRKELEIDEETEVTDADINIYVKGLEIARKKIPAGIVPIITDSTIDKEQNDTKTKIQKMRDKMDNHGKVSTESEE
jgi:hypothetical protein